jgi:hypothetical protein
MDEPRPMEQTSLRDLVVATSEFSPIGEANMRGIGRRSRRWIAYAAISGMGIAGGLGITATASSAAAVFCHSGSTHQNDGAFCSTNGPNTKAFAKTAPGGNVAIATANGSGSTAVAIAG